MEQLSAQALNKLVKEIRDLRQEPIDGVAVIVNEDNVADIQADYEGPSGTPFEGGVFRMKLVIGSDFPQAPPKGYFVTKIFHPNVAPGGEICVNVLKRDWSPDLGLRHVLSVVRCLLIEPNAESALNEEAGRLLLEGFDEFAKKARLLTEIHAQRKPTVLTAAGGANAVNSDGGVAGGDGKPAAAGAPAAAAAPAGGVAKPKAGARPGLDKKRSLKRL